VIVPVSGERDMMDMRDDAGAGVPQSGPTAKIKGMRSS